MKWEMGEREDGTDSVAVQVTHTHTHTPTPPHTHTLTLQVSPASHWPELEVLILVVSADKKEVSSTKGMQMTVQTSPLMKV